MRLKRTFLVLALFVLSLSIATAVYSLPLFQIPPVPHPTEGHEDCLSCHGPGELKPFPEDHAGRTNDMCLACHQVNIPEPIPVIPHSLEGRADCLSCHGPGQVKPFPANHQGRTSEMCLACHQPGGAEAPTPLPTPEPTVTLPPSVEALPTPIQEPVMFEQNTCVACHSGLGGNFSQITTDWSDSVHAERGVGCVSCHGGDPTQTDAAAAMSPEAGFLGPLPKERIPGLCGSCHARVDLMRPFDLPTDQFDQYWQSQHGQALLNGDSNVATCFDCHDGHRVLKVTDPASLVYPTNEPAMCARCHADTALMAPYGIPTNQYDVYQTSVHGVAVLQNLDLRAPTCSTCHGAHGAAPPGLEEVANVCGQCHATTEDYYLQGAHRTGVTSEAVPRCVTCHGQHDITVPTRDLFLGTEDRHCGSCHSPGTDIATQVDAIYQALTVADDAYAQAEATIASATQHRLIMATQQELLEQANTPLIEARALQHTVNVADIQAKTEASLNLSQQAQASAQAALQSLQNRRLGMIVALAVILVIILALVLIKVELDRDLERQRARRRGGPAAEK
jgi:predicted CXXCH cytochrome family protein